MAIHIMRIFKGKLNKCNCIGYVEHAQTYICESAYCVCVYGWEGYLSSAFISIHTRPGTHFWLCHSPIIIWRMPDVFNLNGERFNRKIITRMALYEWLSLYSSLVKVFICFWMWQNQCWVVSRKLKPTLNVTVTKLTFFGHFHLFNLFFSLSVRWFSTRLA